MLAGSSAYAGGVLNEDGAANAETAVSMSTQSHDFSGFYIGVGLGRATVDDPHTEYNVSDNTPNGYAGLNKDTSNAITVSVGYNWNIGRMVLGVEGRIQRRSLDDYVLQTDDGVEDPDYASVYESDLSKQLLLRFGRTVGDASLVYLSAGRVRTDYTRRYIDVADNNAEDVFNDSESGRIAGLGIEHMVSQNYSLRGEINRIWYETTTHTPTIAWSGLYDVHEAIETAITISLVRHF
jgi:hypothetical protein